MKPPIEPNIKQITFLIKIKKNISIIIALAVIFSPERIFVALIYFSLSVGSGKKIQIRQLNWKQNSY